MKQKILKIYRTIVSPMLHFFSGPGSGCRFHPTCSEYFETAIEEHGAIFGTGKAFLRIMRCHPFSKGGYDPVKGKGL